MDLMFYAVRRGFEQIESVYNLIRETGHIGYIAGSYAAYMAAPEGSHIIQPNDVDIFCRSEEDYRNLSLALTEKGMRLTERSMIADTLKPARSDPFCNLALQIIKPHPDWKLFPRDIVNSFDFSVSRAVLMSKEHVEGDPEIGYQNARILRLSDPLRSLKRVVKYAQRGVQFDDWELHKLFLAYGQMSEERKKKMAESVEATRIEDDYDVWYDEDDYFEGE